MHAQTETTTTVDCMLRKSKTTNDTNKEKSQPKNKLTINQKKGRQTHTLGFQEVRKTKHQIFSKIGCDGRNCQRCLLNLHNTRRSARCRRLSNLN